MPFSKVLVANRGEIAIRAEIEDGLVRLGEYLQHWAAYSDWCAKRGVAA